MKLFTKICIVLTLMHLTSAKKYLLERGLVSVKRIHQPWQNSTILNLETIDHHHHLFVDAVKIRIFTRKMTLYEGAVQNLQNLKVLRLKECGIGVLKPKAFKNLPKIEIVHMQDNDLTVIENGVFNFLPIRELWLHKNEITIVQSGAFDNMPNLEVIRLSSNMISKWDSRWFVNTPNLTRINLKRNEISELPSRAFINLKTSHKVGSQEKVDMKIFLSSNNISYIHSEALEGIDSLHVLCLRRNTLKNIDWKMFSHMSELHALNLSLNRLSKIESTAFENMSDMSVLDLSRNLFECIPYDVVSKVKEVILGGNKKFNCQCLSDLKERLREERLNHTIDVGRWICREI